ncbi:MAG: hypothetical protein K6L75_01150 [Cellvibrionaceae bacterium]
MKNLLIIIVLSFVGYFAYQKMDQPEGAFDADGKAKVLFFTFTQCGAPCEDAEKLLINKKVEFEKLVVDTSEAARKKIESFKSGTQMPQLYVGERRVLGFHRDRYREALAEIYGLEVLSPSIRKVIKTHFDENGGPRIVMYGAAWCPHCKAAREYFLSEGIDFKEWDVEKESEAGRNYKLLESSGYPLIYVGYRRFEGFNKEGVLSAVGSHHL